MPTRYRSTFYYEGKQYEAVSSKSQPDADKKAALKEDKLKRGEISISGNMTLKRWASEWLEVYKRPSIGHSQLKRYLNHINGVIIPVIGGMTLKSVKDIHLQKILNSREGKSKSDLSKLRMTMNAMFQRAYQSKLIIRNPAEFLELPSGNEGKRRSITNNERTAILKVAETHHAGLWVLTMLYTGMRPGETRALEWRHIDLDKKVIHVIQSMKAHTDIIGVPKSAAGIRDIPIPDTLYNTLVSYYGNSFSPVFVKPLSKKRHTEKSMMSMWNNFKRELDIHMGAITYRNEIKLSVVAPDLVPYCLRHTYCTDLQDAGVPINIAKYLMGHSDISVTAKIYTHTTDKAIQNAAALINKANNG